MNVLSLMSCFRCIVPECEDVDSSFNASWRSFALSNESHTCRRLAPMLVSQENDTWRTCSADQFFSNHTVHCDKVIYEDYNSIAAEVIIIIIQGTLSTCEHVVCKLYHSSPPPSMTIDNNAELQSRKLLFIK